MGTKATRKDFYREIRKSPGRFLSILFIVALGVAFFSGIRSSEPDMRLTGDAYFDGTNLMDIQVMSTYGVTEDDLAALAEVEGVEAVEGAYSQDFLSTLDDEQTVLHVMSLPEAMNQVAVSEGRLPKAADECMVDNAMGYEIGDEIVLESGTDDPVEDTLGTDTFTVVGKGSSPCYISFERGSTTIGTGTLDGFLVVPKSAFVTEVYTEAYLQVEGAKELTTYTDAYDEKIETMLDRVEDITGERGRIRRDELIAEAQEELDEARQELEDGRKTAQEELADAWSQIEDGESQLEDAKAQIEDGRAQIRDARATMNSKQKELDDGLKQYQDGKDQLEAGKKAYQQGKEEFDAQKAQAEQSFQQLEEQMTTLQGQIETGTEAYNQLQQAIAPLRAPIEELESQIEELREQDPTGESENITAQIAALEEKKREYENSEAGITLKELEGQASKVKTGLDQAQQGYNQLSAGLEEGRKQLEDGQKQLDDTKKQLDASEKELKAAYQEIQSGQSQIDAAWDELESQEQTLKDGEAEIRENEKKLADAKEEYEEGKQEAEDEIAQGEQEIRDAEEEIQDIELPDWYVYDRGNLPEHDGYGENADRMRAIGQVFPVIFFLVAALISLTSMTRMVEEQRIEVGTMKALGYDRFTTASKYLGYALLATVGGSILGVLIGEKILPFIIIYAYGIMYQNIPEILVPYQWSYAAMASAAAVACTIAATLMACYREMGAQPAVLMRPPSPKKGQRVLLERVRIIWNHLNFNWKSAVRNLVRYKKKLFMTVFGIGGCMALMLVGFGLRDSIFEIADLQYGELQFYDGSIFPEEDLSQEERQELETFLKEDPDVEDFLDVDMMNQTLEHGKNTHEAYTCVLSDTQKGRDFLCFRDRKTHESYQLPDDGAIITEKTADLLNVEVGDTIVLRDEEKGDREVKISEICENYMGHYLYLSADYYQELYGEEPEYNAIFFQVPEGYSQDRLEDAGQVILARDEVLSVSYTHDIRSQLDDMLTSLNLVIVVLIISAGMLAFVVLYNLNNISITERQRELATLKVLGFYDPEVAMYVYRENIVLTVLGAAFGIILGRILHLFVIQTVEVDAAMFGRNVNLPSYLYSFLFTLLFTLVVNLVMYFKLKKIDMVESLKSIE